MTGKRLNVPEPGVRALAHEMAYKIARERLAAVSDAAEQCRRCGAQYVPSPGAAIIRHLERSYKISLPDGEVSLTESEEAVPIRDKILILHYFTQASGTPLTGEMITYKELQEGINYYPTFFKRAIEPIVNNFSYDPPKLVETAGRLGGRKVDLGDAAVIIDAFPRVPLTIVMWRGDNEFGPDGNILFDSTIPDYLPTEDVTILCELIAWRLVRLLKTGGDSPGQR
jgi:hypothetical protein